MTLLTLSGVLRLAGRIHPQQFPAPFFFKKFEAAQKQVLLVSNKFEVIQMEMSNKAIKELFYKQIRDLTMKTKMESFDVQFSDRWLQ